MDKDNLLQNPSFLCIKEIISYICSWGGWVMQSGLTSHKKLYCYANTRKIINRYTTLHFFFSDIYIIQEKNPRGKNIQFECSMPMAFDCIINLGLKIHQNSRAEQKYFLYKNTILWYHYKSISGPR